MPFSLTSGCKQTVTERVCEQRPIVQYPVLPSTLKTGESTRDITPVRFLLLTHRMAEKESLPVQVKKEDSNKYADTPDNLSTETLPVHLEKEDSNKYDTPDNLSTETLPVQLEKEGSNKYTNTPDNFPPVISPLTKDRSKPETDTRRMEPNKEQKGSASSCGEEPLSKLSLDHMKENVFFPNSQDSSPCSREMMQKIREIPMSPMARGIARKMTTQEILCNKADCGVDLIAHANRLLKKITALHSESFTQKNVVLREVKVMVEEAWAMFLHGSDIAYMFCEILLAENVIDILVSNLTSADRDLLKVSIGLLEQVLTTPIRNYIADTYLEQVASMCEKYQKDLELATIITSILKSLFKTSEEASIRLIKLGGLGVIIFWCRCSDRAVLKHCAIALSNLALYGGPDVQQEMTNRNVPEWLFPLAFLDDNHVRYYACLTIATLASNKEIESVVLKSGTLNLVLPFIESLDPEEFARVDASYIHGATTGWLKRLVPLLNSQRAEAQMLAAFHMTMEASIKTKQNKKEVLYNTGAVEALKRLASTPNSTASRLARRALTILGEELSYKLSQQVPLWTMEDVVHWVTHVGFGDHAQHFRCCQVDGDLMLRMTEDELKNALKMECPITRKRFMRKLKKLKISADYSSCDPTKLSDWLTNAGHDFAQYTYQMLCAGVDVETLKSLTQDQLENDCSITNGIHRMKILRRVTEMSSASHEKKKLYDVFISYRRSNGSHLAGLLKVQLKTLGYKVFFDVEQEKVGRFDEYLLEGVRQSTTFLLLLTPDALDRCIGDNDNKDFVHREIATALQTGARILPVFSDNFVFPPADKLPADIRVLEKFNGVQWSHYFEHDCINRIKRHLGRGESFDPESGQRTPLI